MNEDQGIEIAAYKVVKYQSKFLTIYNNFHCYFKLEQGIHISEDAHRANKITKEFLESKTVNCYGYKNNKLEHYTLKKEKE